MLLIVFSGDGEIEFGFIFLVFLGLFVEFCFFLCVFLNNCFLVLLRLGMRSKFRDRKEGGEICLGIFGC